MTYNISLRDDSMTELMTLFSNQDLIGEIKVGLSRWHHILFGFGNGYIEC